MPWARLFLATCVALTCSEASYADDMSVGDFLLRCNGLKPVLAGERDADLNNQVTLFWCTSHISEILEDYRARVRNSDKVLKTVGICLPEGTTSADLLLIVLDELQAQDRSASLASVVTSTLAAWWPCK